jgi:hypothetical protein
MCSYLARKPDISQLPIEIIKGFEIFGIIEDIKLIHEIYLIFAVTVKSESRKRWLWKNKKDKSIGSDSPLRVWITNPYPKWILSSYRLILGGIRCECHLVKNRISQKFSGFEKLLLVGGIASFILDPIAIISYAAIKIRNAKLVQVMQLMLC